MYFDPLSTWLVVLISDGLIVTKEKIGIGTVQDKYDRERIRQRNEWLNGDIRRTQKNYGLLYPEFAYKEIQRHIQSAINSYAHSYARGQIVLDLENQVYIIDLLDACSESYSKKSDIESKQKAEWYKKAAEEARIRKKQYLVNLEENRKQDAKDTRTSLLIGAVIVLVVIVLIFLKQ